MYKIVLVTVFFFASANSLSQMDFFSTPSYKYNSLSEKEKEDAREILKDILESPFTDGNPRGHTHLIRAALNENLDGINLLLWYGENVNGQDYDGYTALIYAAAKGNRYMVSILLSAPSIDVNIQSNTGQTALIWAATKGYTEIVRALLSAPSIDVNIQDSDGHTALIEAAWHGYTEIVRALLSAPSIDVNIQNKSGSTALGLAKIDEIKNMLRNAGAVCRRFRRNC